MIAAHNMRKHALTNIRVQMVSGFKLAWWRPIVSWPPEKIRSTVTADPEEMGKLMPKSGVITHLGCRAHRVQSDRGAGTAPDAHTTT
jgi:hypothetical protein